MTDECTCPADGRHDNPDCPHHGIGHHPESKGPFLDWAEFWATDLTEERWLIPGVIAPGRGHSIVAGHKQGKSLFTLAAVLDLVESRPDVLVIWLDYEMSAADLQGRLTDMGRQGKTWPNLAYWLIPTLPALDTKEGGEALEVQFLNTRAAGDYTDTLVVFDTFSRCVRGPENENDTVQAWYRHTGARLKAYGDVATVRLDHLGKDPGKGARGGSAKGDDVDIAWTLKSEQVADGLAFVLDHKGVSRIGWAEQKQLYHLTGAPLKLHRQEETIQLGTASAALLDRIETHAINPEMSGNKAQQQLRALGEQFRSDQFGPAWKVYKRRQETGRLRGIE